MTKLEPRLYQTRKLKASLQLSEVTPGVYLLHTAIEISCILSWKMQEEKGARTAWRQFRGTRLPTKHKLLGLTLSTEERKQKSNEAKSLFMDNMTILLKLLLHVYGCFAYMSVGAPCACLVPRDQKRMSDSLELELQSGSAIQVLGIKPPLGEEPGFLTVPLFIFQKDPKCHTKTLTANYYFKVVQ